MVSTCSGKPECAPLHLSDVCPALLSKQFSVCDWWLPIALYKRKIVECFLCLYTPSCCRWCGVLDFVPAGSVSSFSTLTIFETKTTSGGCFAREFVCSTSSLACSMSREVHLQKSAKADIEYRHMLVWAFYSTFHFLYLLGHGGCEGDGMCGLTVGLSTPSSREFLLNVTRNG